MANLQRFGRAGILMIWGSVFCYFYFSGRITSYLHPNFQLLVAGAGGVLVLLAMLVLFVPSESDEVLAVAGCEPMGPLPFSMRLLSGVLLVIPLLVAVRSSPSEFGATMVMNRGYISSVSQLPMVVNLPDEPLPGMAAGDGSGSVMDYLTRNEKGQIMTEAIDLLYAAEEPSMRKDFEGREVELVGQYMPAKDNNPNGNRFKLVRMFMMCCAADAQPLAVLIQPDAMEKFSPMTWVKVTGRSVFPTEGGARIAIVENAHVEQTDPPADLFVY